MPLLSFSRGTTPLFSPGAQWRDDGTATTCMARQCRRRFTFLVARHHCRWCGDVFCDTCAPCNRLFRGKRHRCCARCTLPFIFRSVVARQPFPGKCNTGPGKANDAAADFDADAALQARPLHLIFSFLTPRDITALLQSCHTMLAEVPLPNFPFLRSIQVRFPSFYDGAQIGKGGFGVVYKCEDRHNPQRRFVAIKRLTKASVLTYSMWCRTLMELSILARVRHRHVARLLEVFQTREYVVMVLEAGDGGTLGQACEYVRQHRLPLESFVASIVVQVATALDALYRGYGVIHRDIKFDNVVMSRDFDRAMIIDFGLAEHVHDGHEQEDWGNILAEGMRALGKRCAHNASPSPSPSPACGGRCATTHTATGDKDATAPIDEPDSRQRRMPPACRVASSATVGASIGSATTSPSTQTRFGLEDWSSPMNRLDSTRRLGHSPDTTSTVAVATVCQDRIQDTKEDTIHDTIHICDATDSIPHESIPCHSQHRSPSPHLGDDRTGRSARRTVCAECDDGPRCGRVDADTAAYAATHRTYCEERVWNALCGSIENDDRVWGVADERRRRRRANTGWPSRADRGGGCVRDEQWPHTCHCRLSIATGGQARWMGAYSCAGGGVAVQADPVSGLCGDCRAKEAADAATDEWASCVGVEAGWTTNESFRRTEHRQHTPNTCAGYDSHGTIDGGRARRDTQQHHQQQQQQNEIDEGIHLSEEPPPPPQKVNDLQEQPQPQQRRIHDALCACEPQETKSCANGMSGDGCCYDVALRRYMAAGTAGYASPENVKAVLAGVPMFIARGGTMHRADIFSLGVVAYMMLTLHRPLHSGNFARQYAELRRDGGVRCTGARWAAYSDTVRLLIERMLALRTMDRPTAEGIVRDEALRKIIDGTHEERGGTVDGGVPSTGRSVVTDGGAPQESSNAEDTGNNSHGGATTKESNGTGYTDGGVNVDGKRAKGMLAVVLHRRAWLQRDEVEERAQWVKL